MSEGQGAGAQDPGLDPVIGTSDLSRLIDQAVPGDGASLAGASVWFEGAPDAGEVVGRYRLGRLLGEGGMGSVFEAEQLHPIRRRVAVKLIKLGMDTRQVVARFEAERQALAIMDHPSIAKVFDAGVTSRGRPFFAMELVEGVPITRFCDESGYSTRQRLDLFVQVCNAVQHAHMKGIIHRDLKPSNVLVSTHDSRAVPKVIDFGVAKAIDARLTERTLFTEQRQFIGTPEYMSPEQANGAGGDVDTRSDVYSLGVLLYELLTGLPPFDGRRLRKAGYDEIQRIIREEDPPRPSTRLSGLASMGAPSGSAASDLARPAVGLGGQTPAQVSRQLRGDLDWIVMKALEKERERRYESAGAFAADVLRHMADQPVEASPASITYRCRKFARRHVGVLLAIASVAIVIVLGFVTTAAGFVRASQQRTRAVFAEEEAIRQRDAAVRSREEAIAALDQAEETTRFVVGMIAAPNPSQLGREVTVREVLDRAVGALPAFDSRPLTQARLHEVTGRTYQSLGHLDLAEPHLEAALAARRRLSAPASAEMVSSLEAMAALRKAQGDHSAAEALFREAQEASKRTFGPGDGRTFVAINNVAGSLRAQERYAEAEPLFEASLQGMQKTLGPENPATLLAMNNLALVRKAQGKYAQAQPLAKETLELQRKVNGPDHPDTLLAMHNLGGLYLDMGRFDMAGPLLEDAYQQRVQVLGGDHPDTLLTEHMLGGYYLRMRQFEQALSTFEHVRSVGRVALGENNHLVLRTTASIGRVYLDRREPAAAEPLLRDLLERQREVLGGEHDDTLGTMHLLAGCLMMLRKADEAFPLFEQALDARHRAHGDAHPESIMVLRNLARAYRSNSRLPEAAEAFCRLVNANVALYGEGDERSLAAMHAAAEALVRLDRFEEAEPLALACFEGRKRLFGLADDRTVNAIKLLVILYDGSGSAEEEARWRKELSASLAATRPSTRGAGPNSVDPPATSQPAS